MMRGPRGPRGGAKPQNLKATVARLMGYVGRYRLRLVLVLFCILGNTIASVTASTFIKTLIDDYITPMIGQINPDFSGLLTQLVYMACIYGVGMVCGYLYNRLMVVVAQGVLKNVRDDMFAHMQTLPIRYFDTHSHGEIMSHYTNDTDTLRQMIAQALPQVFSSMISIVAVFVAMLSQSLWLTLTVVLFTALIMWVTGRVSGKSGKFFVKQQQSLASVNGYIEEMMNGQKVVKVFCHEQKAQEGFDRVNDALFESADMANKYANILMPIMVNIGNIQYVIVAMAGGLMALGGVGGGVTLGVIASFLQLSKSFSQPISQISQQLNSVVMALAGAGRIFALMDEESERDEGTVTLVNAAYDQAGELGESGQRTNLWAWKVPQKEGGFAYTRLTGDVRFFDVDFEYEAGKPILHDISLFAKPGQKLAFVGATGAGKTTITNLINRFYDIADGKIRYDGININKIRKSDLRRSLGIVLQETNLFTGTVRENIRYGNLQATDEEVVQT